MPKPSIDNFEGGILEISKQIKAQPGATAERYLGDYHPEMLKGLSMRKAVREAAFFLPFLRSGMRLLDCGCGPGSMTVDLAEVVAPGEVVGIDIAAEQFALGAARARETGVTNVRFEQGSLYELPFPDESFDAVFVHAVLYHLSDPQKALREIYRVLKPGGVVGARESDQDGDVYAPLNVDLERVHAILSKVHRLSGGNARFGKTLRAALRVAGFAHIEASASYDSYGAPEIVKAVGAQFSRLFLQPQIVDTVIAQGWAEQAEIEDLVATLETWGDHPDAFFARCRCEAVGRKL